MSRGPQETFEDFRARRALHKKVIKAMLRGEMIWDASERGTYIRAKHGELK